jgi:glutamyl-tRNA synthetase
MVNFLALLGWSPGSGDRELFSSVELTEVFDLSGISGGNAVFNPEKLDWYNQQYLARLAPEELARRLKPSFEEAGLWDDEFLGNRHAWFFGVVELLRPRVKRLTDFADAGRYFFSDDLEFDEAAVAKHVRVEGMAAHLAALDSGWASLETFEAVSLEASLREVAEARGIKAAALIHAVRVALTGRSASPGLFEVAAFLGRGRVHQRLAGRQYG